MDPFVTSPTTPSVISYLQNHIFYALDNNIFSESLFFAERLYGHAPDVADSVFLLSLCHFRAHQFQSAFECSRARGLDGKHLGCAYIFAQASLELGKCGEGIDALENCKHLWRGTDCWSE